MDWNIPNKEYNRIWNIICNKNISEICCNKYPKKDNKNTAKSGNEKVLSNRNSNKVIYI